MNLSVKQWSPEDRPREKLLSKGVFALSDAELLAIILGSGNQEESVVKLSQRLLQSNDNNLNQLAKLSVKQLMEWKGIGEAKAIGIVAALELGKRRQAETITERKKIRATSDIYALFYPLLCDLPHEEFWALFLNAKSGIIDKMKISQGGVAATIVDPKIIYKEALLRLASSVILCHNHPSGNPLPSHQDDAVTMRLCEGLKILDMHLSDHVILGEGSFYSYADEGRI
jgi:DNA repair protein RadC